MRAFFQMCAGITLRVKHSRTPSAGLQTAEAGDRCTRALYRTIGLGYNPPHQERLPRIRQLGSYLAFKCSRPVRSPTAPRVVLATRRTRDGRPIRPIRGVSDGPVRMSGQGGNDDSKSSRRRNRLRYGRATIRRSGSSARAHHVLYPQALSPHPAAKGGPIARHMRPGCSLRGRLLPSMPCANGSNDEDADE
jgi:hypothetical protein